jgi:hypothetical protein
LGPAILRGNLKSCEEREEWFNYIVKSSW